MGLTLSTYVHIYGETLILVLLKAKIFLKLWYLPCDDTKETVPFWDGRLCQGESLSALLEWKTWLLCWLLFQTVELILEHSSIVTYSLNNTPSDSLLTNL